jgi:hypothetical protein
MLSRAFRHGAGLVAAAALAGGGLAAGAARADAALPGASALLTRAPYLSDLTTTSVQVSWGTATRGAGVVEYGPAGNCTAHSVTAAPGIATSVNGVTEYQNSVAVTGLSASASYCYRVSTGGSNAVDLLGPGTPSPQFATLAAAAGRRLTFDVLGDWGDTTDSGVNNGALNANQAGVDAHIASSGAQFVISAGDVGYPDGSQANYGDLDQTGQNVSGVFGPAYWAVPGQRLPMFAATGSHGRNLTFLSVWPEPATTGASAGVYRAVAYPSIDGSSAASYPTSYYAFTAGGARFYVLDASWGYNNVGTASGGRCGSPCAMYELDHDAHWTASSAEYTWLAADLAGHRGGLKFAIFHFPLYSDDTAEPGDAYLDNTPGSSGSLEQLLHDGGVQLAFTGHAHDYQRNIAVPGGVTSYVTGGGGGSASAVGLGGCSTTDAYAVGWTYSRPAKGTACGAAVRPPNDSYVYHFLKVTVSGTTVTVTPTDSQGRTFDVHTYDFAPDSTPPSAPGNLTAAQPHAPATVLSWTGASDAIGVSAYDIYRDGSYLATVGPGVTSYTDTTATSGTAHTYRVAARDLAGNTASATVSTGGAGEPVFADGFETGNLSRWSTVSGLTVQSAITENGSYAAEAASTGTPSYAYTALPGSHPDLWAQFWVYLKRQATSVTLAGFRTASASPIIDLYLNPKGVLSLRNDVGAVTTYSTTTLPRDGWHLVVLHATTGTASGAEQVSLDGVPVPGLTLTGQDLGSKPIACLKLGDNTAGRSYDVLFDQVAVTQAAPPSAPGHAVGGAR